MRRGERGMRSDAWWPAATIAGLLLAAAVGVHARAEAPPGKPVVAGYLPGWAATPELIAKLPAESLTHVIYAFGSVGADGVASLGDPCRDVGDCGTGRPTGGNFAALRWLKEQHPHLKMMISLGGWNGSRHFSGVAASPQGRERLATSAVELFIEAYGGIFDGIDLDWEYPVEGGLPANPRREEDQENFTLLVAAMREGLDRTTSNGERRLLTVAVPGSRWLMRNFEIERLAGLVDWFGLMTYDYVAGAHETGFNAPLFAADPGDAAAPSADRSVEAYLAAGAPPDRVVLGLPLYGRAFGDVPPGPAGDGLGQPGRPAPEEFSQADTIPHREIVASEPVANGFREHHHDIAGASWLYHPGRRLWITYDDRESLERKAAFVRARGLRGVMVWELTGDGGGLVDGVAEALRR